MTLAEPKIKLSKPRTMSISAITFDVDWAPEWAIEQCIALCRAYSVPATFFVTHPSPALKAVADDPLFELGIHPNFSSGSSHGSDFKQVLDYCAELVPSARSMRTHALVQSSPLFVLICDNYPRIETDVSLFLPNHPGLQPTELYLGETHRGIIRLPYFWEDDVCAEWPGWSWSQAIPQSDGLRIFDFHPVYIALNMKRLQNYRQLKQVLGSRRLYDSTPDDFAPYINHDHGARTFFIRVLETARPEDFKLISEISADFKGRK